MNLLDAVIHPFNFCNSFSVFGGFILMITFIFYRLSSIPLCEIMKPMNFPAFTPKTHLSGLSLTLYLSSFFRTYSKSIEWSSTVQLLTIRLSIYTSMVLLMSSLKMKFMNLWYVAPAFLSPKGITL